MGKAKVSGAIVEVSDGIPVSELVEKGFLPKKRIAYLITPDGANSLLTEDTLVKPEDVVAHHPLWQAG